MKYWSCCNKKTSDFNAFLEQVGCSQGNHCWIKDLVNIVLILNKKKKKMIISLKAEVSIK
jgi:hypothetical protein